MPFELVTVPCLSDNYAFLLRESASGQTAVVDVPDASAVKSATDTRGWTLHEIWLTHHHSDHIGGVEDLREWTGAAVVGHAADIARLPRLDRAVSAGERFDFAGAEVTVMDVSGHTIGHVAFYVPDAAAVFTGDSLMALGCGRLFEGTARQMWDSLSRLAKLPADTQVCSGHEYTASNARFALTIEPENARLKTRAERVFAAARDAAPTVPSLLSEELDTNPFLRAGLPDVKSALSLEDMADADVFAEIRRRKDAF